MVEPVDPGQCRELHGFEDLRLSASMDQFGFVEAIECLEKSMSIRVATATDRALDANLVTASAASNGDISRSLSGSCATLSRWPALSLTHGC